MIGGRSLVAGMVLLACAVASPAAAQSRSSGTPALAVRVTHEFGQCIVDHAPTKAAQILGEDFRTKTYARAIRKFAQEQRSCAGLTRLKMPELLMAGGIAEALLPRELAGGSLATRTAIDPAHPIIAHGEPEVMSICLVREAPNEVAALLASKPVSDEENAAMAALAPKLSGCLASGAKLKLNTPSLRAMLALSAERLVRNYNTALAANGS